MRRILELLVDMEDPDARAAVLAAQCEGDATLRREVENILAAGEHLPNVLTLPPEDS